MLLSVLEYYTIKMQEGFFLLLLKDHTNSFPIKSVLKCSIKKYCYHNAVNTATKILI